MSFEDLLIHGVFVGFGGGVCVCFFFGGKLGAAKEVLVLHFLSKQNY